MDEGEVVDLLFASSGIERQIVEAAGSIEILEDLTVRVATTAHLIAMKVLSRDDAARPQDRADLPALLQQACDDARRAAREALTLVSARGCHRGGNLAAEFEAFVEST